jgi:hypothetical protein
MIQYQAFDFVIGGLLGIGADSTFDDQHGIAYLLCPYTDGLAVICHVDLLSAYGAGQIPTTVCVGNGEGVACEKMRKYYGE